MIGELHENLAALAVVAAGPTRLRGVYALNVDNELSWIQIFDAAATGDVTLGTTAPDMSIPVAASGGTREITFPEEGVTFNAGIVVAATKGASNSTAADAGVHANFVFDN